MGSATEPLRRRRVARRLCVICFMCGHAFVAVHHFGGKPRPSPLTAGEQSKGDFLNQEMIPGPSGFGDRKEGSQVRGSGKAPV